MESQQLARKVRSFIHSFETRRYIKAGAKELAALLVRKEDTAVLLVLLNLQLH